MKLKFKRVSTRVEAPALATSGSACFDVCAYLPEGDEVVGYSPLSEEKKTVQVKDGSLKFSHLSRLMIPTGIHFEIPAGYSVKIYPRSGNSIKKGYSLCNSVGVVDSDFRDEVKILMINYGHDSYIQNGDRVAQMELVKVGDLVLEQIDDVADAGTDRKGGFGSTGK
jgi:dUTP pyrophosphatase